MKVLYGATLLGALLVAAVAIELASAPVNALHRHLGGRPCARR